MKKYLKKIVKEWMPPAMLRLLQNVINRYGYYGNYSSWEEAEKDSTGYDADVILQRVKEALLKVKRGEAVYERDSVLFDTVEYSWPLLAGLLWIASLNGNKLNVVDFGGSLGTSYFQNRKFLDHLNNLRWNIVEQKKFVECGKQHFEDEILRFYPDLSECLKEQDPHIVLLSGVIQYMEKPYELLDELMHTGFPYMIIDRTPFLEKGKDRITVQKVPPKIYPANYPAWLFNEERFLKHISGKYVMAGEFIALDGELILSGGGLVKHKGFIFQRKT